MQTTLISIALLAAIGVQAKPAADPQYLFNTYTPYSLFGSHTPVQRVIYPQLTPLSPAPVLQQSAAKDGSEELVDETDCVECTEADIEPDQGKPFGTHFDMRKLRTHLSNAGQRLKPGAGAWILSDSLGKVKGQRTKVVGQHLVSKIQESPADRKARIFHIYDLNDNGKITAIEMRFGEAKLGTDPDRLDTVSENQAEIDELDLDNDGQMNFEEFDIGFDDYVGRYFAGFDLDGDQLLTAQEMYLVDHDLNQEDDDLTADDWLHVISGVEYWMTGLPHYQGDADGMLDVQEFTALVFAGV